MNPSSEETTSEPLHHPPTRIQDAPWSASPFHGDERQVENQFESSWRWGLGAILLLLVGFLLWWQWPAVSGFWDLLRDQDRVSGYLLAFGVWGPFALALAQLAQVLIAIIPGHVFLIAGGYVYGFTAGFLMNLTFTVGASQLVFLLARRLGRPFVNRLTPPDSLARWQQIAEDHGFIFFTISFLLPIFPTDAMNFVAGLTGISSRRFFAANLLGRLPSVVMLTLIGSHGLQFSNLTWGLVALFFAALYIIGRFFIIRLERRYKHHDHDAHDQKGERY